MFKVNLTLKSEISFLKVENWAIFFQDWLNFHSLEWDDSILKNLESI